MDFIERTIEVAMENVKEGGRPFACLIVKDGKVLVEAANQVAQSHDPTAHAEILAIQKGSQLLKSEHFEGCEFYILAHPCPMCLAAMYYCSPKRVILSQRVKSIPNTMSIIGNILPYKIFMKKFACPGNSGLCQWFTILTREPLMFTNYGKR